MTPYNAAAYGVSHGSTGRVAATPQNPGDVMDGLTCVNYHTVTSASGEIRGQLVR